MNRYIIIAIVVLLIAGVAVIGGLLLSNPTNPAPVIQQQGTSPQPVSSTVSIPVGRTQEAARATFQQAIDKNNIDNIKLYETAIAGDYALQVWVGDVMGGEALLKYDTTQARWVIVESSGGTWSVGTLVSVGVPTTTAQALVAGIAQ